MLGRTDALLQALLAQLGSELVVCHKVQEFPPRAVRMCAFRARQAPLVIGVIEERTDLTLWVMAGIKLSNFEFGSQDDALFQFGMFGEMGEGGSKMLLRGRNPIISLDQLAAYL